MAKKQIIKSSRDRNASINFKTVRYRFKKPPKTGLKLPIK